MSDLPAGYPADRLGHLPVGEKGVVAPAGGPVVFPFDGRVVATAPLGDTATARLAIDEAVGVADELPDGVVTWAFE